MHAEPSPSIEALRGYQWLLISIDGLEIEQSKDKRFTYIEMAEDANIHGLAGCNRFSGQAQLVGNTLKVSRLMMTKMMCHGERLRIESILTDMLEQGAEISLSGNTLTLKSAQHSMMFQYRNKSN